MYIKHEASNNVRSSVNSRRFTIDNTLWIWTHWQNFSSIEIVLIERATIKDIVYGCHYFETVWFCG